MTRAAVLGAVFAVAGAFPLAATTALFYAFPVPLTGKLSGPSAVLPSQIAVVMYGIMGGFPVLAVAGAVAGLIAFKLGSPNRSRVGVLCAVLALVCSAAGVVLLATLDLIIGPW
jgi:hypothetical protein